MLMLKKLTQSPYTKWLLLGLLMVLYTTTPAFAALEDSMESLQGKIKAISTPLAIMFLMFAGWQKSMGNNYLFVAAIMGTVIMFAAPQVVTFVSSTFGG